MMSFPFFKNNEERQREQQRQHAQQQQRDDVEVFRVTIPPGVSPGQHFQTCVESRIVLVQCPPDGRSGQALTISVPRWQSQDTVRQENTHTSDDVSVEYQQPREEEPRPPPECNDSHLFEVTVPPGVQPGRPFSLMAGGQRILVNCPQNARQGDRIRFRVPDAMIHPRKIDDDAVAKIRLQYNRDGWARNVRMMDLKLQWIRMDDKGDICSFEHRFDIDRSAYVRKLEFGKPYEGLRTGRLSLIPAEDAVADSCIKGAGGKDVVSYTEFANAQVLPFQEKAEWFHATCARILKVPWSGGHMQINVRRESIVVDSLNAILTMNRRELRKHWRFHFLGEEGIDAGGLTRAWFQLVTEEIFNGDMGLWQSSAVNQMCMQINPVSAFCCDGHLAFFRFLGRVVGRALMDRQLVAGHMLQHIYKHILGWPVTFKDLKRVDEESYKSLKNLVNMAKSGEDFSALCLDFTTAQEMLGQKEEIELVKGGADIELTTENLPEYLEAYLKYRMLYQVEDQLNELLLGIFDVIPEPLLTVFDFQELEMILCGMPEIDVGDWRANTEYSGDFDYTYGDHEVCEWFWEVVCEFDRETRTRLLQFVTGTSGVPARGFCCLQGNDGAIRRFEVHGVNPRDCYYPRAHTCFNRLDLPLYDTKEQLRERLKFSIAMGGTGFDME